MQNLLQAKRQMLLLEEEIEAIGVDAVIEKGKLFFRKMEKEIRFYMIIRLRDFLKMRQKLLIM